MQRNTQVSIQKNMVGNMKRGFTLIELLVVVSIIGVLTAIILPNMVSMRERAKDSRTKSNLDELKTALRLYYNDYQSYPTDNGAGKMMGCGTDGNELCSPDGAFTAGVQTYMKQLPSSFYYEQIDSGDGFLIYVVLNNLSDSEVDTATVVGESGQRCGQTTPKAEGAYYVCSS